MIRENKIHLSDLKRYMWERQCSLPYDNFKYYIHIYGNICTTDLRAYERLTHNDQLSWSGSSTGRARSGLNFVGLSCYYTRSGEGDARIILICCKTSVRHLNSMYNHIQVRKRKKEHNKNKTKETKTKTKNNKTKPKQNNKTNTFQI